MINKDTKVIVLIGQKNGFKEGNQGEYRLEEALRLLVPYNQYLLREIILHNKALRDMLRECGAELLIDELKLYAPDDFYLNKAMDEFVEEYKDKKLADFDVLYHPVDEPLSFFGHAISFKSKYKNVDVVLTDPYKEFKTSVHPENRQLYIGAIIKETPGFYHDDYDEPGCVESTYVIRDKKLKKSELLSIYNSQDVHGNFINSASRLHENTKTRHLPMVYYDGRSGYMLVAVQR